MSGFPGTRPIHGDAAYVRIGDEPLVFAGKILVRGFTKRGQGYAELVLPDADPRQRRDLERAGRYRFELYRDGQELYASPELTLHHAERDGDGALVLTGHP